MRDGFAGVLSNGTNKKQWGPIQTGCLFRQGSEQRSQGNACPTVVTALVIRLARRAVMRSPPHRYRAPQRAQRPLNWQCGAGLACYQLWSLWPISCPVVWTPALWLILCLRAHSLPWDHVAGWPPTPQLRWLFGMTASASHPLQELWNRGSVQSCLSVRVITILDVSIKL